MDLIETLRSTGAVRDFTDEPVDDAVLARVLDTARFAPSGANAQAWRVVVVKDQQIRSRLRDLYSPGWADYLTLTAAGLRPWSPVNDRAAEREALSAGAGHTGEPGGFAAHLDTVPVLLMVFADLAQLAAVDRDLDRYTFAGGASVYPFVWSLLLAARAEGLGGVLTTMLIRQEDEVKRLLAAPPQLALAAAVALGHPVHQPTRLRRGSVASFTTVDRVDGTPLPTENN
ncbi:nitroreductase [Mycolicibacterium anyangense]|uniref:Nitroreductase n=1 Tax=Mycolicibacterium anyangense TaxID=1431246 RepID=A0A6N4W5B7_9MYCO|nr:nitroreductase family protein [Mycolicibacterium anyangense]BBZ75573.1 nitroreductase [Mycolicibacterium anyangense]